MRYGRLRISAIMFSDLLMLTRDSAPATRRVTDFPDDIRILGIEYEQSHQIWIVTLCGSGSPLLKISEGAEIPFIDPPVLEQIKP